MPGAHIQTHGVGRTLCNLRAASQERGFAQNVPMLRFSVTSAGRVLLALFVFTLALPAGAGAGAAQITLEQARSVAMLVARHESINVDDADTMVDSMDGNGSFVSGYFSFIFIAVDPHQPGKDRTLAMYAVNARTGDTWELNLCKHYSFPELLRVQRAIRKKTGAALADEAAAAKVVGCGKTPETVSN